MYPEELTAPMRQELVDANFIDLSTPESVEEFMGDTSSTAFVLINSVCGCAASSARPGVIMALDSAAKKPGRTATVFAGVDNAATQKMREFTAPYPPSSPSMALFKNGELVHFVERHFIEGRPPSLVAQHLQGVFEEYC